MSFLLVSIFKMQVFLILDVLGGGGFSTPHTHIDRNCFEGLWDVPKCGRILIFVAVPSI